VGVWVCVWVGGCVCTSVMRVGVVTRNCTQTAAAERDRVMQQVTALVAGLVQNQIDRANVYIASSDSFIGVIASLSRRLGRR
jgi:hypothetical protein